MGLTLALSVAGLSASAWLGLYLVHVLVMNGSPSFSIVLPVELVGALAGLHLRLQFLEGAGTSGQAARLRVPVLRGSGLFDVCLECRDRSAVNLPARLPQLLLQLVALVLVEAELLLEVLHSLFQRVEVLVVSLGLGLQGLVHFHQIVVEGYQLLHFGECVLCHFLVGLELVLVEVLEALQFLLQLFGVADEDLVLVGQELDALLKLLLLRVLAICDFIELTFGHLEVMQHDVG